MDGIGFSKYQGLCGMEEDLVDYTIDPLKDRPKFIKEYEVWFDIDVYQAKYIGIFPNYKQDQNIPNLVHGTKNKGEREWLDNIHPSKV